MVRREKQSFFREKEAQICLIWCTLDSLSAMKDDWVGPVGPKDTTKDDEEAEETTVSRPPQQQQHETRRSNSGELKSSLFIRTVP